LGVIKKDFIGVVSAQWQAFRRTGEGMVPVWRPQLFRHTCARAEPRRCSSTRK
jgi:hypothetical protein